MQALHKNQGKHRQTDGGLLRSITPLPYPNIKPGCERVKNMVLCAFFTLAACIACGLVAYWTTLVEAQPIDYDRAAMYAEHDPEAATWLSAAAEDDKLSQGEYEIAKMIWDQRRRAERKRAALVRIRASGTRIRTR